MPHEASLTPSRLSERFRILFPVGKGGMGTVEVALEKGAGTFRRIIAVKHMLKEVSRERRNVDMFLREASLAQMLNHPNVVHAFEAGELDGELYISMEYVEGEPLSTVLRRAKDGVGGLSPVLAAYVLAEICDGLHAAHELRDAEGKSLNVVHRDLSPHNVMVSYEGHVKVLDFGVAKVDDAKNVTRTGEVKGKTAYMAPEQALGDQIDRRSDLFAVGAVLFECLTGRRMWGQATDIQLMRRLALEEAPRLENEMADAPPAVVELYTKLVARKPEQRPENARDVARELRAYISTTGELADDRALKALMQECFTFEATEKRKLLEDSLAGVVDPVRSKELRKSLSLSTAPLTETERRMIAALKAPDLPPRVAVAPADAENRARPQASGLSDTFAAVDRRASISASSSASATAAATEATTLPLVRTSRRAVGAVLIGVVVLGVGGAAIASLTRDQAILTNDQKDEDAAAVTSAVLSPSSSSAVALPAAAVSSAPFPTPATSLEAEIAASAAPLAPTTTPTLTAKASATRPPAHPPRTPHPATNQPDIDDHAL